MIKEFVPYAESLELKQLGFDEPCFFAFDNCSTPMRCTDLRTGEQRFNGVNYNSSSYTSQPTFSQAFRWFREKHDLFGIVQGKGYNHRRYYMYTINGEWHPSQSTFDIYEEAELACLRKLIEIVKNK